MKFCPSRLSTCSNLTVPALIHWREVKNERERKAQKAGEAALDTEKKKPEEQQKPYASSM